MEDATRRLVDSTLIGEAVESLPLAVFVSDAALNHIAVNAAAAALVGLPRSRVLELRVPDLVPRPQRELQRDVRAVESEGFAAGEGVLRRGDGELVEVRYATLRAQVGRLPVLVSFVLAKDEAAGGGALLEALSQRA